MFQGTGLKCDQNFEVIHIKRVFLSKSLYNSEVVSNFFITYLEMYMIQ